MNEGELVGLFPNGVGPFRAENRGGLSTPPNLQTVGRSETSTPFLVTPTDGKFMNCTVQPNHSNQDYSYIKAQEQV